MPQVSWLNRIPGLALQLIGSVHQILQSSVLGYKMFYVFWPYFLVGQG